MVDVEQITRNWVDWYNEGTLAKPEIFYAPDVDFQRMGLQQRLSGVEAVSGFLQDEAARCAGRKLEIVEIAAHDDAVALEAQCVGFDAEAQDFDTPNIRLGPTLIFMTIRNGLIAQDHSYISAPPPPKRNRPQGIDEIKWESSSQPLPNVLEHWQHTYNTDPIAMMLECYTEDGTVEAMYPGSAPFRMQKQIALEKHSWEIFPDHRIEMKRWLEVPGVIAVEFTWQAHHRRYPDRSLSTISACYLRLSEGLIAIDHSYLPTGLG